MLHKLRVLVSLLCILLAFLVILLPISIVVLPLEKRRRLKITQRFWKLLAHVIFFILRIPVKIIDERKNRTGLYISNHQSVVDIPLVLFKIRIAPIMKSEILKIPLFGICARSAGAIAVDRSIPNSRRAALNAATQELDDGMSLQYYPEGTRNRESNAPKEFEFIKVALINYAYQRNIPVFPISIAGSADIMNKDTILNFNASPRLKFSQELLPENFEDAELFARACWQVVRDGYKELEADT